MPNSVALPRWLTIGVATAAAMLWEIGAVALPPHGEHAWRDATGIGVARGFLDESWNLLSPRVAERGGGAGITGMEFPLVPWLSAALMRLLRESYFVARLPCWLSLIPLTFAALALARRVLLDESSARLAAACVVLQPLVVIFSHKLMPEIPMLALLLAGAAWAIDGLRGSWPRALLGASTLALAAVLKPTGPAIAIPLVAAVVTEYRQGRSLGLIARSLFVGGIPVISGAVWFAHARAVSEATGFDPVRLHNDWWEWTHLLFEPNFLSVVFGRIAHLYLLLPTVIWMAWRWRTSLGLLRELPVLPIWMVGSMAVVVLFGSHNFQHSYYAIPATVPFSFWAGAFAVREAQTSLHSERVLTAFLLVFAITSAIRTLPRFPGVDFDPARIETALRSVPDESPALVTDAHSPVVSLVIFHRTGWGMPASSITPALLESLRAQGAIQVIESNLGGWLTDDVRSILPPPSYEDDQFRIYRLAPSHFN